MTQTVTLPNGSVHNFPDGATPEMIAGALGVGYGDEPQQQPEQPGAMSDIGKSLAGGFERGVAALPMVLPNMINQMAAGPQLLGRGIAENVDKLAGIQPQPRGELWQPFYSSEDVLQMLPENMKPHNAQTPYGVGADLIGQMGGNIAAGKVITSPKTAEFVKSQDSGVSTGLASGGIVPVIGGAAKEAGNIAKGIKARSPDKLDEAISGIRNEASNSYKALRDSGAVLTPDAKIRVVDTINKDVGSTGPLQKTLHSGYLGVMKDFQKASKSSDMGLEEIDQYRQLFRDVVERNIDKGRLNGDAMKAQTAIKAIDKIVTKFGKNDIVGGDTSAVQNLLAGRANWAKASRVEDIANIVRRSGGNINKLKADIFKFASNKNNIRGWSTEEIAALKNAAKNSNTEALTKMFGTLGFDIKKPVSGGSNVIPALETVAAIGQAPYATPMLIGGTAAKTAQGLIGRGKVEELLNTLQNRKQ